MSESYLVYHYCTVDTFKSMVDTDDDDNVIMRDCVETPNCYCLAQVEDRGRITVYPYNLSSWESFDVRATVIPIRHCPRCGRRLRPHMEESDIGTLYYTCSCCGHHEKGWPDAEETDRLERILNSCLERAEEDENFE